MDSITAEEIISEWHEKKIPDLIKREINFELPETGNAVAVIGPRRAGKSFFLYDIIYNRLDVDLEDTLLINLEDHRFGIPDKKDLDTILTTYYGMYPEKDDKRAYIFFDEVQNVEGWERYIRSIMDRYNATVFISGSSSKLLSREIATSMRGRSISYLVMPFSFREFLSVKEFRISRSSKGKSLMLQRLKEYLRYGGFPDVVLEKEEMIKRKLLRGYVEVMLFRDVVERYEIKHVKVLKLLMKQMMASTANSLSINKFYGFLKSQGIRIDKNTIYEYKDHLVDAFGFIELKRIDSSFRTIEQGKPKIYPIDTGYMTDYGQDLDNNMGRYMETCVAVELRRRIEEQPGQDIHFWRKNSEIDFVISDEEKVKTLIQVCYDIEDEKTLQREINGLIDGSKDLGCEDLLLLNWNKEYEVKVNGRIVKVMPLWSWLNG